MCISIEPDGQDKWIATDSTDTKEYKNIDPITLRNRIREAGIVGLGGAAFPSAVKLNPGPHRHIDTLLINAAECEPYITCDEMLLQECADDVIAGIKILKHCLQVENCIIGIEDSMPKAHAALEAAIKNTQAENIKLVVVPTIYPTGSERQLIKVITNKEVPVNGLPADIGIVCHNPGTAVAIYEAIIHGKPLISRVVTVTGKGVKQARNVEALFGTPIKDLINFCGGYNENIDRLIMGGAMMGFAMYSDELPITKASNCILVTQKR